MHFCVSSVIIQVSIEMLRNLGSLQDSGMRFEGLLRTDPWLSTTEKWNKVDFAVICPSRRDPPLFKTFKLGDRLYFDQLFYCSFNTPQVLEWAVLAPVSADVVLTLLPYTDSIAKESTLRLFLVLKGRYFSEHGMYVYTLFDTTLRTIENIIDMCFICQEMGHNGMKWWCCWSMFFFQTPAL